MNFLVLWFGKVPRPILELLGVEGTPNPSPSNPPSPHPLPHPRLLELLLVFCFCLAAKMT